MRQRFAKEDSGIENRQNRRLTIYKSGADGKKGSNAGGGSTDVGDVSWMRSNYSPGALPQRL